MNDRNKFANVYEYANYRKFLEAYQTNRLKTDKRFKRSVICRRLGLPNTRSYFNEVVKGRKDISPSFAERFVSVFNLNENEARYFCTLVQFNQSKVEKERDLLFNQLIAMNKTPKKFVNKKEYTYYSEWQHSVIRALLDVMDFSNDYKTLTKNLFPTISETKAKNSIKLLKELGFIKKNKQGYWKPNSKVLTTGLYSQDEMVKQYQLKTLEIGKQALLTLKNEPNSTSTMTLSMSPEIQQKIEERIQNLKKEICTLVHKDPKPASVVYQFNMQFFPHFKKFTL
ncbi:MAG: TIGR02147 family protein [Fibrobacteria bacterium]|nr:TIGR02147 family protein [Fibrobacteria bacterium]